MRHPTKAHAIAKLKQMGVPVGTVLDVGILSATYELLTGYADKHQVLMEPIVEFEDRIRKKYTDANVSHELVMVAVSNRNGTVPMRTASVRDDVNITHARMTDESSAPADNVRVVPTQTLDSIVKERNLEKPYFLKVDVDGAELDVLEGAKETLQDCSVVCIETGISTLFERGNVIHKAGFQLFDISDICYYDDRFVQADLLFLNHKTIQEYGFHVYKDGFDFNKWNPYDPYTK